MMDTYLHKCEKLDMWNIHELSRNRTFYDRIRVEYLSTYIFKFTEKELKISKQCLIIKWMNLYFVYTFLMTKMWTDIIPNL